MEEKKYKCDLWLSAEETTTGTMMLTKSEYEIVNRVSNIRNWDNLDLGVWTGGFGIYCEELEKQEDEGK